MRVVHCKKEPYDVYIGRPSKWGNPYSHKDNTKAQFKVDTREEAVWRYEVMMLKWIEDHPDILEEIKKELKGKVLGCWCAPKACHGDILLRLANE